MVEETARSATQRPTVTAAEEREQRAREREARESERARAREEREASEPEPEPSPEPVDPETVNLLARNITGDFWVSDDVRAALASDIGSSFLSVAESLDNVVWDEEAGVIVLHVTSIFGGDSGYFDRNPDDLTGDSWALAQLLAEGVGAYIDSFDETDDAPEVDWEQAHPGLAVSIDGDRHHVDCPGGLLVRVARVQASRSDFEAECTIR